MLFHAKEFSSELFDIKYYFIPGIDTLNIFIQRFHAIKNIILYTRREPLDFLLVNMIVFV